MTPQWIVTDVLCPKCKTVERTVLPVRGLPSVEAWQCAGCGQATAYQVGVGLPIEDGSNLFALVAGDECLDRLVAGHRES